MELLNQPFTGQLGNRLIEQLESADYHTLNVAVAFAKTSGVLRLKDSIQNFRDKGGVVNINVGVDLGVTSYEALQSLLLCTDSLNVVHSEKSQTFHSKVYHFLGDEKGVIIVGSNNMTGGGLWTNFESSSYINISMKEPDDVKKVKALEQYFQGLAAIGKSFLPIKSTDDIELLLDKGYIHKEVSQKIYLAKTNRKVNAREALFGNGVPASLPSIDVPVKETAKSLPKQTKQEVIEHEEEQIQQVEASNTIWLETRALTGGSRNILDLSKKSLVVKGNPTGTRFDLGERKFMRGGVEFFDVPPLETTRTKDITINFEGTDYRENTILYPDGEKKNGTWRLQIKGVSTSGQKITDAFRAKGEKYYLVQKIVTFTKITDDYYFMSVFPGSELQDFKTTSTILAHNGSTRTAKWIGFL